MAAAAATTVTATGPPAVGEPGGRHLPPFYCPYCGEERIRPAGEQAGEWACELCRRVWRLRLVGGVTDSADPGGPEPAGPHR